MCEILAPAKNGENFIAAVESGANAVYLGLKEFSARKGADNFSREELKFYVSYAKLFNIKTYLTLNTLIKDGELNDFISAAKYAYSVGVEAVILQDMFLGKVLKAEIPDLTLHLSTQAGVCNVYGARLAKNYGFSRVILARETNLSDIKKISEIIETEAFVQGALCTSFSGHCYASAFIGGNSGNRGLCKQPCRKKYDLTVDGKVVLKGYPISLSDLCVSNDITALIDAGVTSFKIEGRMRSEEYVRSSVLYYKGILSGNSDENYFIALKKSFNRGDYTKGLAFGQKSDFISSKIQGHSGYNCAEISKVEKDRIIAVGYDFKGGESYKIISNGYETGSGFSENVNGKIVLRYKGNVKIGDFVSITKDDNLNKFLKRERLKPISVSLTVKAGEKLKVAVNGKVYESDFIAERAKSSPLDVSDFEICFSKTDKFPFYVNFSVEEFDEVFIPKSLLNKFRSAIYESEFYIKELKIADNIEKYTINSKTENCNCKGLLAQIVGDDFVLNENLFVSDYIYSPTDFGNINVNLLSKLKRCSERVWLYLPPFASGEDLKIIEKSLDGFYGVYGNGYYTMEFASEKGLKLFAGTGFNVFNKADFNELLVYGAEKICYSIELSFNEIIKTGFSGFIFSGGDIEIMNLQYCPFGKNCNRCVYGKNAILKDENGRNFPIERYKISTCAFRVYNCYKMRLNAEKYENFGLLEDDRLNDFYCKDSKTCGNLKKGVL